MHLPDRRKPGLRFPRAHGPWRQVMHGVRRAMLSNIRQRTAECVWTDYRRPRIVLSLQNQWAVVALPAACFLGTAGCSTPGDMEPVSFSSPPAVETVADLLLPADERAALLRAATAALERNPDPLPVVHTEGILHVLPDGFMRIRHFGFLANRAKKHLLPQCRKLLNLDPALPRCSMESAKDVLLKITGVDLSRCPCCKQGTMIMVGELPAIAPSPRWDSS